MDEKKIILSGIQPTGVFTLGNYIGAIKNWGKMQEDYECAYFIADLHSLTVYQEPAKLRKQTMDCFALLLACGIDPEKSLIFVQSTVNTHAQLSWILSNVTQFGELGRMTQFKDKSEKHPDNINAGLFTYPVLMAADILLYQADMVPVGADQKQHLEFTRNIAERFNSRYGQTFKIPEPYIAEAGARVMSLQDPLKKMSKSDENANGFISILDDENVIINKFKRAVTDSEREIVFREGKDGINNLLTIYSVLTGKTIHEAELEFEGKGYGDFKLAVGQVVADSLKPIRDDFARLSKEKTYLEELIAKGAETAYKVSNRTLSKAKRKVGLI
ncbi:MAG: tryptophan--tRNA ligase [Lachnospiraceae bacterium]|jgi:tryptophanyl-tRNA synthetase|nr:tryptophan--tRNA ligase [Lachnospiraceae bacterium]MCR4927661.1 tryptophan--tRNA ligase [Lachnospiraceae bacterium]